MLSKPPVTRSSMRRLSAGTSKVAGKCPTRRPPLRPQATRQRSVKWSSASFTAGRRHHPTEHLGPEALAAQMWRAVSVPLCRSHHAGGGRSAASTASGASNGTMCPTLASSTYAASAIS